jgi:hypothetical protein
MLETIVAWFMYASPYLAMGALAFAAVILVIRAIVAFGVKPVLNK